LNRREALQKVTFILGGTISIASATAIMTGCKTDKETGSPTAGSASAALGTFKVSTDQQAMIDELAEIIIPKTDTPGAKEAGVGAFITMMLGDCYSKVQQDHFMKGLSMVEAEAKKAGGSLVSLDAAKKIEVMKLIKAAGDAEKKANEEKKAAEVKVVDSESGLTKEAQKKKDEVEVPVPFFNILRELTTFGYYSSEIGAKSNLNYVAVPGKYQGCIKVDANTKPYAL
jgi:hypothetical protein